ncbi:hypothetical protein V6D40_06180 [Corynebacterium sp. Q4381]|uniref:alpha/beta fold hydrolase n=1 Tax=Corynebacterium sp. Marseille-Q4381 TaxID=3121597 RepID=UPI002FE5A247
MLNAGREDFSTDIEGPLRAAISAFIRPSGGLYGTDLKEMSIAKDTWKPWIDRLETLGFDLGPISKSFASTEFWSHLISPSGAPTSLGSSLPLENFWDTMSGGVRYLRTNGRFGSPPAFGLIAEEGGISSSRSGWGETERDLSEETHWTMWTGPARGRGAHQDSGRVTFHSQGIPWIIDLPGDEFGAAAHHSIVEVEQRRFRDNARSQIIRSSSDALMDEVVVAPKTYLPAQWNRDLVFVKSNHYVVVKDTIRASSEISGYVHWIIHPEVEVTLRGDRAFCTYGSRTLCICIFGTIDSDLELQEIKDGSGGIAARRLSASFTGQSSRIITAIADVVDATEFSITRKPAPGHWIVLDHTDKGVSERLVNSTEGSILADPTSSVEQSIEEAERRLAQGEISDSEALAQRLRTRSVIEEVKEKAWKDPSVENRQRLIKYLDSFCEEHRVTGLRDHALGAAMVDLAGVDISDLPSHAAVTARKRTNLVSWGEGEEQTFYRTPIISTRSPELADGEPPQDDFVWSVDCGQVVPSALVRPKSGDTLLVYLHGATDRTRHSMPRYERVRSLSYVAQGPVAFFSDPTLDLDSRMILSWYIGHEDLDLHRVIAQMVDSLARRYGVERVTIVGNSGGGFSAMQVASHLRGASFISINGQTDIERYTPLLADQAAWAVFGKTAIEEFSVDELKRWSVLTRFQEIEFDVRGLVLQNTGDDHHFTEHFLPLKDLVGRSSSTHGIQFKEEFMGDGHVAPAPASYQQIVRNWLDAERMGGESYVGLRTI